MIRWNTTWSGRIRTDDPWIIEQIGFGF